VRPQQDGSPARLHAQGTRGFIGCLNSFTARALGHRVGLDQKGHALEARHHLSKQLKGLANHLLRHYRLAMTVIKWSR
jgi:hypothetical protein